MTTTTPAAAASRAKAAAVTMKAAQVPAPGAEFEIVEREIPTPGAGQVRLRVQACGVCHSDVVVKDGSFPGIQYPRVPGHGTGVTGWEQGRRVGVGSARRP